MYLINEICIDKSIYTTTKKIFTDQEPILGNDNKYHYCYEVKIPNKNWHYRGVRSSDDWKNDNYLGSSSYYCYNDDINSNEFIEFNILSFHKTRKQAEFFERKIVDKIYVKRNDTYNLTTPNGLSNYGRKQITNIHTNQTISVNPGDSILENNDWISGTNFSPVEQYTLKGEFIKSYNTIKQAAEDNNTTKYIIRNICYGRKTDLNGSVFLYIK